MTWKVYPRLYEAVVENIQCNEMSSQDYMARLEKIQFNDILGS